MVDPSTPAPLEVLRRIAEAQDRYGQACDETDLETIGALFTADAVVTSTERHVGHDAVLGFYAAAFAARTSPVRHTIAVSGATAVASDRWEIDATFTATLAADPERVVAEGTYTDVVVLAADGTVRFAEKHITSVAADR